MVPSVAGCRDGEQRGDRPALDDLDVVVGQAPFDVLRVAEVGFDPPAQLFEPHGLGIRQRRVLPAGTLDDLAVPYRDDVGVHQAGDQGLARAEHRLDGGDLPVPRDRVRREEDAARLRNDHVLDHDRHAGRPVVDAVAEAVGHGPLGEE